MHRTQEGLASQMTGVAKHIVSMQAADSAVRLVLTSFPNVSPTSLRSAWGWPPPQCLLLLFLGFEVPAAGGIARQSGRVERRAAAEPTSAPWCYARGSLRRVARARLGQTMLVRSGGTWVTFVLLPETAERRTHTHARARTHTHTQLSGTLCRFSVVRCYHLRSPAPPQALVRTHTHSAETHNFNDLSFFQHALHGMQYANRASFHPERSH